MLPEHAHIGLAERAFLEDLLVRDPEHRLGARPDGHRAVLAHPWFEGISAIQFLGKQIPAPWLPHLNGPLPTGEATAEPTAEHTAMITNHAQGRELIVDFADFAGPVPPAADPLDEWGTPVVLQTAAPNPHQAPSPPSPPSPPPSLSDRQVWPSTAEAEAEEPAPASMTAQACVEGATGCHTGSCVAVDASPASLLDLPADTTRDSEHSADRADNSSPSSFVRAAGSDALRDFDQLSAAHLR